MAVLRAGRRLVLLLAVLLGVVTMHSLAVDTIAVRTTVSSAMTATSHQMPEHAETQATDNTALGAASASTVPTVMAALSQIARPNPMPMPMPGHDLMHLCLAVLAAFVVLTMLLILLTRERLLASTASSDEHQPVQPTPRRPPPRHAVRQAELCVLRN